MADILEEIQDGVAVVTLNRPEARNAMSREMMAGILEILPRLARDKSVGCVVLTGAGGAFCAGGDVKGFAAAEGHEGAAGAGTFEDAVANLRGGMEASRWLHEMPKPTIAALPGAAAGAGLSMALACDLRIAAQGAKLTTAFGKVGLSGDYGGSYFLSRLVGTGKARELYYFADVILAEEAERLGIVNKVVAKDQLMATTMEWAMRLAKGPRVAISYMKKNMNLAEEARLGASLDMEAIHHTRSAGTADHKEAAIAFVEKRAPNFQGR